MQSSQTVHRCNGRSLLIGPLTAGDRDSAEPDINPDAMESPHNGIDDDCDRAVPTDVDGHLYDRAATDSDGYVDGIPANR